MSKAEKLTADEQIFALRMLPHLQSGLGFADAARSVLDDDVRLLAALCDRRHYQYVHTADERGSSYLTREGTGDAIVSHLARNVFAAISTQEPRS